MNIFKKWYWRMVIAIAVGCVAFAVMTKIVVLAWFGESSLWRIASFIDSILGWDYRDYGPVINVLFIGLPTALAAVLTYCLVTKRYGPKPIDSETRCRKCGYILRGITEPRCSECGERI